MNDKSKKMQKIAELISAIRKAKGLEEEVAAGDIPLQENYELLQEYKQKYPESSLGISEDTRNELENVFSQIDDYLDKGIIPQESRFTLPKVPSYLKELGSDETEISLPVSVIKKARETHGLSNEEIKNSLTRLYDPVAVFDTDKTKSENRLDSKLILTDEFSESKPIALALNTNAQIQVEEDGHRKFIEVQDIRSIHDRTLTAKNGTDLVKQWTENGLCRYVDDKKISEWSTVARVYFPIEALHSDKNNILTKSEIVNQHGIVAESEREYQKTNDKELEQWYETVDWEDPMESAEAWQNGTQEQIAYIRKRRNEKIIDREIESEQDNNLTSYIERFSKETEERSDEIQLQKAIELALEKNTVQLTEVKLNRENWNRFFPNGSVETPIGTVKLGENQFNKLQKEDRNNLLAAMYETLSNPSIVLEKETLDKNSGDFKPVNVYGKSFVREDSNHKRIVESVVIFKDGDEISIGTHNKDIGRFTRQIKTADQIIFADSEISRVASLILENGGSHVQLKGINTQALNSNYSKDTLLSIKKIQGQLKSQDEIIDRGIESVQSNVGMSEAAMEAEIAAQNNASYESEEEYSDEIDTFFYDTNGNPHAPQKIIAVLENFQEIEPSKWNLSAEEKTAVFHLTQVAEIGKKDFDNSLAKLKEYMRTEEFEKEEINYAKVLTPILLTSLGQDFDEKTHAFSSEKFSYKFSTDDLKKEIPVENGSSLEEPRKIEKAASEKKPETKKDNVSYQDFAAGKIIYGRTVLPPFASMTSGGHLKTCENFVVKGYDSENGTYIAENGDERLSIPRETFNSLLNPAGVPKSQQEEKIFRMEGNGIVFDNPEKGVKGTVIPEFSLMTQNGLLTYKDCVVAKFNESDRTYTLRNNDSIISVTEGQFKEITSPERFENKFDENTPAYKKLLKTQYEDFFKERANTAYNFRHNLSVFCRKEANSPCDALKVAKGIIQKMSPAEQDRTKKLLKKIAREGESLNQLIVRAYHEAVREVPLNEEYIKHYQPENRIARPFYDTLSADGQKIDSDPQLLRTDKDYNLKIGDTLKDIDIKSGKIFGHGKENVHFSGLKVISASKEGNTVTLMDREKSFIEIPRDTVLKAYKEQQLKELRHQQSHSRRNRMELSYS